MAMGRGSNQILTDLRGFKETETGYKIRENPLNPRHPRSIAVEVCSLMQRGRSAAGVILTTGLERRATSGAVRSSYPFFGDSN